MSEAPNSVSRGAANKRHMHIRIIAEPQSIVKEVFIMVLALFSSPIPLLIENKGAPPLPKRLLKAVIIIIIGKHSPTAPRAFVPTWEFLQCTLCLQYCITDLKSVPQA